MSDSATVGTPYVQVDSHLEEGSLDTMAVDIREGLSRPFKEIPPKYFYDARGSELFDLITEQPEYYQTRAERSILNRRHRRSSRSPTPTNWSSSGRVRSKTRALLYAMSGAGACVATCRSTCRRRSSSAAPSSSSSCSPASRCTVGRRFRTHLVHLPAGSTAVRVLGGTIGTCAFAADRVPEDDRRSDRRR